MGWSTELFCNISFLRETYNTKEEVLNEIEQLNELINYYQTELRDYAMITEPNKFFKEEKENNVYDIISRNIKDFFSDLERCYIKKYKLTLLLDNWEQCHKDNLAIPLPKNMSYDIAYLEGDFINTLKEENNKEEVNTNIKNQ